MSDNTSIGDRMKLYEGLENGRRLMPLLPVLARIDGRAFHSFTKGLPRPYDPKLTELMVETAKRLCAETCACMAYVQSDEITLAWHSTDPKSQVWFDGRVAKMTSQLAAHATLWFNRLLPQFLPASYGDRLPTFDARVWAVPNRAEGANVFVWREWDATKNSISMAASTHYGDEELHGKSGSQKQEMLFQRGVNWNDYPAAFLRGTYVQRRTTNLPFTYAELERLPPKHQARFDPSLIVKRAEWRALDLPPITSISNREDVIFSGSDPQLYPSV